MREITCRRTKWCRSGGSFEIGRGYYWGEYGPFSSREAAESFKERKEASIQEENEKLGEEE